MRGRAGSRRAWTSLAVLLPLVASGCGGPEDALAPKSRQVHDITLLFWWMLAVAAIGLGLVVTLLLLSFKRRHRRGLGRDTEGDTPGERASWYVVVGAGIVLPLGLIVALFVISDIFVIRTTQAPAASDTRLTVEVVGHQWWWEVRYPGTARGHGQRDPHPGRHARATSRSRTADVIHSFWVPRAEPQDRRDPGPTERDRCSYADTAGPLPRPVRRVLRPAARAHGASTSFAEPPAAFDGAGSRTSGAGPAAGDRSARRAQRLFVARAVRELPHDPRHRATGGVGPDLTHLASRTTLAALTLPNTRAELRRWIVDPQHVKPGNKMPDLALSATPSCARSSPTSRRSR